MIYSLSILQSLNKKVDIGNLCLAHFWDPPDLRSPSVSFGLRVFQGLPGGAQQELGRSHACGVLRHALHGVAHRDDPWDFSKNRWTN